jgi:hypothetical protein
VQRVDEEQAEQHPTKELSGGFTASSGGMKIMILLTVSSLIYPSTSITNSKDRSPRVKSWRPSDQGLWQRLFGG